MPTPTEIFEQAASEIAAGRVQEGARLVYEAAFGAVAATAARYAVLCENDQDAMKFLRRLDNIPFVPGEWHKAFDPSGQSLLPIPEYTAGFDVARSFKEHAETPLHQQAKDRILYWRPEEYVIFLPAVAGLIAELDGAQSPKDPAWTGKLT